MSAIWQRIWAIARPILTNPATWTALISILGSLFGVPMLAPAPSVSLPQTLSVKPMAVVPLPVSHSSWMTSALDIDHDSPDAQIFTLQGGQPAIQFPTAGTYRVHAHLARLGKMGHAHMTVQVGDAPNPPGPNPPGPEPTDPFTKAMRDAFNADADPAKAQHVQLLAGIYRVIGSKVVSDSTLNTLADLFNYLHAAVENLNMPAGVLPGVRKVIGQDLGAVLGTTPTTPLDAATRQKAASEFGKIAAALSTIGG